MIKAGAASEPLAPFSATGKHRTQHHLRAPSLHNITTLSPSVDLFFFRNTFLDCTHNPDLSLLLTSKPQIGEHFQLPEVDGHLANPFLAGGAFVACATN